MRLARALVVASIAIACAPPAANSALKPPGSGWSCFRQTAPEPSSACMRTADACASARDAMAKSFPGRTFSECSRQDRAGCATFYDLQRRRPATYCTASLEDCSRQTEQIRNDPQRSVWYEDITRCETWE